MSYHLEVLSAEDLTFFRENGYVRVSEAFSPEVAGALRAEVWRELESEHGIRVPRMMRVKFLLPQSMQLA
jgi:hypothetical protein